MAPKVTRLVYKTFGSYDHVDADAGEISFSRSVEQRQCPCCLSEFGEFVHTPAQQSQQLHMLVCDGCGWWHLHRTETFNMTAEGSQVSTITARWWELWHAVYSEIDIGATTLPIDDLRLYLARRWNDRKHISAQAAEDLIASILREHYSGDIQRLTANATTPDGGIDLFVVSRDGLIRRAVQVKRRITRPVEAVAEVRNFVGAMLLEGADFGVFVTTADRFSRQARAISQNMNLSRHQLKLELIDGERLLELLEHTNATRAVKLPPLVNIDSEWISTGGISLTTHELLFERLSRLNPPSP